MSNDPEQISNLSLAAAMAQSYARDQQGFAALVAILLENSLPNQVEVNRKPIRMFSSEKRVAGVKIMLGEEQFELIDPGNNRPLIAKKSKVVRGITLKNEETPVHAWLSDLESAVRKYSEGNEHASEAIADFLRAHGV